MSQPQPHPESDLLTPLHPVHDADPDHWPEFEVTNARVTTPDSDDLVPLLTATEHNPLVLTGSLQPLSDEYRNRYIGQGTRRSDTIRVPDVRLFAYETSDSDDEVTARQARKGRSSLRLKPSAPGGKSAKAASKGGKGKAPAFPDPKHDPDDDEESEDELKSSPTQKRQPDEPTAHESRSPASRHRKRGTSHPHHPPHDPTTDHAASSSNNNPTNQAAHLPPTPSTSSSSPPTSPPPTSDPSQLNHTADPLQENTWTCALDGCTHKIYLASEPGSQRLIREHYKLHAYDDDERS
ncbi:hypothetical protein D0860_01034 [Hortaea werneckii]|uniref:Uncharacterized protein n=1 Tax=Hortaea werneckii TaxID=91943 RepID=A0A3M7HT25_HORWE|nr:hypothetical protein D0860_01034 [Hortaea werneckii]